MANRRRREAESLATASSSADNGSVSNHTNINQDLNTIVQNLQGLTGYGNPAVIAQDQRPPKLNNEENWPMYKALLTRGQGHLCFVAAIEFYSKIRLTYA